MIDNKSEFKELSLSFWNRGIWSRVYSIRTPIQKILQTVNEKNPGVNINILSLGAGFDTSFFVLKQKFNNFKYFEFDYGNNTNRKIDLIKKSELLKSVFTSNKTDSKDEGFEIEANNIYSKSKDYYLLECDLSNFDKLNENLCAFPDFDFSSPTIIIAEALLVYIEKEATYKLLKNFTDNFKNLIILVSDVVGTNDEFIRRMVDKFVGKDIIFGNDIKDVNAQKERLLKTGFKKAEVYDMKEYYENCVPSEERKRIEQLEVVDDVEKMNLMLKHTCFGYGTKLEDKYEFLNDAVKLKKDNSIINSII